MPTDEERIAAVRAMTPPELNTYVAMNLGAIVEKQRICQEACQTRLELMEETVKTTQRNVDRHDGWLKAIWFITGGLVLALVSLAAASLRRP